MEWCSIYALIFLILLYAGITVTIVITIVQSPLALSSGIVIFIVLLSILMGLVISCIIYYLVRACQASAMSVHPNHSTPPSPPPIPLQTKSGTLVQQPDGHLQIAIYEHPTSTNHPTTQVQ